MRERWSEAEESRNHLPGQQENDMARGRGLACITQESRRILLALLTPHITGKFVVWLFLPLFRFKDFRFLSSSSSSVNMSSSPSTPNLFWHDTLCNAIYGANLDHPYLLIRSSFHFLSMQIFQFVGFLSISLNCGSQNLHGTLGLLTLHCTTNPGSNPF